MLNQFVTVGRLTKDIEMVTEENGRFKATVTLAVPRSFKNENGEYDTDFIDVILWQGVAENTKEYCRKGDLIGIKGRVQSKTEDNKNIMEIVAEKVTFLSSTSSKNDPVGEPEKEEQNGREENN